MKKFFVTCINCGAHLDPGESCDCEQRETEALNARKASRSRRLLSSEPSEQDMLMRAWEEFDYK